MPLSRRADRTPRGPCLWGRGPRIFGYGSPLKRHLTEDHIVLIVVAILVGMTIILSGAPSLVIRIVTALM